jgi:hypothetical protein
VAHDSVSLSAQLDATLRAMIAAFRFTGIPVTTVGRLVAVDDYARVLRLVAVF